jgi:hypothetical protein
MQKISVLDHGFVQLVDYMGSDLSISRAANTHSRVRATLQTRQVGNELV